MRKFLFNILLVLISIWSYGQTFTFTNCSATGRTGPTQAQVNTAYSGTNLTGNVTINTQGIQEWTVPTSGLYRITAKGAQGGSTHATYPGGKGSTMIGEFNLTAGQVIKIIVGQQGALGLTGSWGHGGGGGSFVATSANLPLIVAGGGGGASPSRGVSGLDAVVGNNGGAGTNGGAGGTGGNG